MIKENYMISDLHLHSRFSRACSKDLNFENLAKWGKIKGLDLIGTADFTHPVWFQEIKDKLQSNGKGFYFFDDFMFLITGEISLIYSQNGKGRKVHLNLLVPSIEIAEKINNYIDSRGFRRDYDGRPIFGISCEEFVGAVKKISDEVEVIPAHCLPGNTLIHTNNSLKKIKEVRKGDLVYTHNNRWKKVVDVFSRKYSGKIYRIRPWCWTEGVEVTPEHPFYAIKSYKKCRTTKGICKAGCSKENECKDKKYLNYKNQWIMAKALEKGDFLIYPRFNSVQDISKVDISNYISDYRLFKEKYLLPKNSRNNRNFINKNIEINEKFCRLAGYYLAEGYTSGENAVGFSFNKKEESYIKEVVYLMEKVFGFKNFKIDSRREEQRDLVFFSRVLNGFFKNFYNSKARKADTKVLPCFMLSLPLHKQVEIFRGWYRGDKGYTTSRELMNQMKIICIRLGIIPNIGVNATKEEHKKRGKHFIGDREIIANHDLYSLGNLSFFEDKFNLLKEKEFKEFKTKLSRRHGWIEEDYIYLPIRKIDIREYDDFVYNLEVEDDNSFVSEFSCIHNCWTPYFGVFGSMSGFDSLEEAFGSQVDKIHSIETGISSDREMNNKILEFSKRKISIVSFSDSHSFWPWRLGREATIFKKTDSFSELIRQIREDDFIGTVETEPAYGKYHWDGHAKCGFSCSPEESKKLNNVCPKCGGKLTIGVENRVEELSSGLKEDDKIEYKILPLHELISLYFGNGINSKKVWGLYNQLIEKFENEFNILLNVSEEELKNVDFIDDKLIGLILKNRSGDIQVNPGYDGEYGKAVLDFPVEKQGKLFLF